MSIIAAERGRPVPRPQVDALRWLDNPSAGVRPSNRAIWRALARKGLVEGDDKDGYRLTRDGRMLLVRRQNCDEEYAAERGRPVSRPQLDALVWLDNPSAEVRPGNRAIWRALARKGLVEGDDKDGYRLTRDGRMLLVRRQISDEVFAKALGDTAWQRTDLGALTRVEHGGHEYAVVVDLERDRPARLEGWDGTEVFTWPASRSTTVDLRDAAARTLRPV